MNSQSSSNSGLVALLDLHRKELLRFLSARCGDADLAEDLLQDLWIKASSLAAGPVVNGRAYLFRMANNLVLDHVRGRRRAMARDRQWIADGESEGVSPEEQPDPDPAADEQIAVRQEVEALEAAIAALPAGAQRALRLHRMDGHGQAKVAEIMGISVSGVEKHLSVAMKHLRRQLLDCGLIGGTASEGQKASRGGEPRMERVND